MFLKYRSPKVSWVPQITVLKNIGQSILNPNTSGMIANAESALQIHRTNAEESPHPNEITDEVHFIRKFC